MADAFKTFRLTEIRDVAAKITFATATTLTAVSCKLVDNTNAVVGGISATAGGFVNSTGGLTSDTIWIVSYDDFDPSTLGIAVGSYTMRLLATRADGDKFCPEVTVNVTN